jgi:hypothetical protein
MQTIYSDGTIQYVYTQLLASNGSLYEGSVDGQSLLGGNIKILEYKKAVVSVNPATIIWIDAVKLWKIQINTANITQYGSMFVTVYGTEIQTKVVEVHVNILESIAATSTDVSALSLSIDDDLNAFNVALSSTINAEVLNALDTFNVPNIDDMNNAVYNSVTNAFNTSILSNRNLIDLIRILDIFFTGTVVNAGSGTTTFTGSDGSTINVVGDDLGNRSSVVVNLV